MNDFKNNIIDIAHNYYKYLMSLENVVGVGLGHKFINRINTLEPCIHVLVKNKISKEHLTQNNIIPNKYMGIKTDVLNVGVFKTTSEDIVFPKKLRPLQIGCVIGLQSKKFSGTLGCIVTKNILVDNFEDEDSDNENFNDFDNKKKLFIKEYYFLSNNHVIANVNEASIGSLIIQPSKSYDGIFPKDLVGVLDTFIPIKFIENGNKPINYVDCAIARITNKSYISNEILSIGKIKGVSKAELDMKVNKIGFASGITEGIVTTLNTTSTVEFSNKKSAFFKDQILANSITMDGDSGGALLTKDNEIVGLLMAGTSKNYSKCNDINKIFKELNVELYTG